MKSASCNFCLYTLMMSLFLSFVNSKMLPKYFINKLLGVRYKGNKNMSQKLKVEIFIIHVFLHKIGCASAK